MDSDQLGKIFFQFQLKWLQFIILYFLRQLFVDFYTHVADSSAVRLFFHDSHVSFLRILYRCTSLFVLKNYVFYLFTSLLDSNSAGNIKIFSSFKDYQQDAVMFILQISQVILF